ncbi:hypothetical protein ACQ4LE_009969 [Meloidogyne hapla]
MNLNNTSTSFPILSNSTNSLNLFNNFNGHQFPFDYLILQIILFLFTLISIFMNSIIVGTTIYSNQLKEHCHMLIATESGCNALLQFNRWIPFFLALTDINFISLYKCFWLQILPLFVSLIGTGLILVIGIERLICIAFPLWFQKKSSQIIIHLLNAINIGTAIYACLMVFISSSDQNYRQNQVICQISDIFSDPFTNALIFIRGEIIHVLIIIIYLIVMLLISIKFKDLSEVSKEFNKSLLGIVLVEIFCWCPIVFFPYTISLLNLDQYGLLYLSTIYYLILAVASSANLPLLYNLSKLYREEIQKFLKSIKYLIWKQPSNTVMDVTLVRSNVKLNNTNS